MNRESDNMGLIFYRSSIFVKRN